MYRRRLPSCCLRLSVSALATKTILREGVGEVELYPSVRALRIGLRIMSTGKIRLVIPRRATEEEALRFLDSKVEWIRRTLQKVERRKVLHEPALRLDMSDLERKQRIEELRRRAKADLPARIERLSRLTGLRYEGVTLRAVRSKWGSCSGRNTISLNIFLMILPEHLRDFVIIHELCHTREHNHSPRFHALVNGFCGGRERMFERELKEYSIIG